MIFLMLHNHYFITINNANDFEIIYYLCVRISITFYDGAETNNRGRFARNSSVN